jgi:uncharacterized protein
VTTEGFQNWLATKKRKRLGMRVLGRALIISLFLLCVCLSYVAALEVPEHPKGRITDFTSTLSLNEISFLEQKLADHEINTTNQIAVLMIPSLEGDNLEDYSIRLADKWKIGQKGKDNGVILLIVKNDRKLRIEVGYGLEGALPDGLAGSIIRDEIAPHFRKNQFFEGINRGTDAIIRAISPGLHPKTPKVREAPHSPIPLWAWVVFVLLPLIVGVLVFFYWYRLVEKWDRLAEKAHQLSGFGSWAKVVEFLGWAGGFFLFGFFSHVSHNKIRMTYLLPAGALILIAVIVHILRYSGPGADDPHYGAWGFSGGGFSDGGGGGGGFSGGGGGFGGGGASGGW